ncbi:MAG: S1/P1 nuclease, partial [Alistipes dispar]
LGDMHCPMHLGRATDLGGNLRPVRFFDKETNLHSVWDTSLVESAHKWSYTEWQRQIDRLTKQEAEAVAAGTPADWVAETLEICRKVYDETPEGSRISYDYIAAATPVIERQLLRAGHRLARLLNEIYR